MAAKRFLILPEWKRLRHDARAIQEEKAKDVYRQHLESQGDQTDA
jgi:hypothetical protein